MTSKPVSIRLVFASITLIAITLAGLAASFGEIDFLRFFEVHAEKPSALAVQNSSKTEFATIGTCDTAGPIEVESSGGTTTPTAYATLKDSFDAINAGTHTGTINIEVCGNSTESAPAVLNSTGAGTASYTAVLIRPLLDGLTISGATTTGRGLIELNGADNVTIDGDNPNTAGTNRNLTLTNTAANTITYTSVVRVALATTIVTSADNDTIKNLVINGSATGRNIATATSTTGSENLGYGIIATGGASTVSATTAPSPIASTTTTIGTGATANNLTVDNNTITTAARGVAVQGAATTVFPGLAISNNVIGNTTVGAADGVYSFGITAQGSTNALISSNTVNVESFLATSIRGIDTGSISATGTGFTISRNRVNRVLNKSTGGQGAYGINIVSGNGHTVRNNFVGNVINVANATFSTTFGSFGIRVGTGTGHFVYHNSVNMYGNLTGTGAALTAGFCITSTTLTGIDVRNNIFVNTQTESGATTPASSAFVAINLPTSGTSSINLTLNNNDYYIGATPAVNNGYGQKGTTAGGTNFFTTFNAADTADPTNLRTYTSTLSAAGTNDNASKAVDPQFVSALDLHVAVASPVVDMGVDVGVLQDIDGQNRVPPPDIGADEPSGLTPPMNDVAATTIVNPPNGSTRGAGVAFTPQATYTNVGTNAQTNVTVRFRILDAGMAAVYNQTATIASINSGGSATVSFPSATVATAGSYATNASAELAGDENTGNDSVQGTLTVIPAFNGIYNVGTGETITSLTNAGGLFDQINSAGATGSLQINITSDLTAETGTIALNEISGGFTLIINPSGTARTISGSSTTAIIKINGADGVTIDGSLSGGMANVVGGNPAIRNLTIQNTSAAATGGAVVAVFEGTNGAQNFTIKNVKVSGQDPTQTLLGIHIGGNAVGTSPTTANNNNSRIENCSVQKAILGIFDNGLTATPATGTVITQNDLSATGANRLRRAGIFFFSQDGIQVTENSIGGIETNEGADAIGIIAGNQNVTTTTVTGGGVSNANISRNKINGVVNNGTVGFSAAGIVVGGGTAGANTISNNMITGVSAASTSPDLVAGIFVTSATGSNTKLYFNSVAMTGDRMVSGGSTGQMPSFGIAYTADVALELKDNIFYTTQISTGGGANAKSYAIGTLATTFANLDSNFNDFWSTGANDGGFRSGSLSTAAGTDYADLAAWQTATTKDANSQETDPLFVNDLNDLHLQAMTPVENDGTPVAGITIDLDGNPRSMTTPEIGADELFVPGTLQFNPSTYSVGEGGGSVTLTVTRTGGSDGAVTVDYSLANGTATGGASCGAGIDFVNTGGTVSFANGETSKTFNVAICEDTVFESDESFTSTLSNATGGATIGMPATATVTITENKGQPTVQFSSATYSTTETLSGGQNGVAPGATIAVTLSGVSQSAVMVNYATGGGSATGGTTCTAGIDYINASGTLTFNPGETNKTFFVQTCPDMVVEGDETVNLTLSNPVGTTLGTPNAAVLTIVDNDVMACGTGSPIEIISTGGLNTPTGYPTLKDSFDAVNVGTHTGSINVNVCGNTTETATASLDASGVGTTSYTNVTVRPVGGQRIIEGTISGAVIKLNGADNVTIDGRLGGMGTSRDLTVRNFATTSPTAAVWLSSGTVADSGSTNNVIRNLEIATGTDSSAAGANTAIGIVMSGVTISTLSNGVDNDNNQFIFNRIIKARNGIVTRGTTTNLSLNTVVSDNIIGPNSFGSDQIGKTGILMQADTGAVVSRNTIQFVGCLEPQACTGSDRVGIGIGSEAWSATDTTTITSANYTVTNNIIHDVVEENTFSAIGIKLGTTQAGGATNNLVANNFIYNLRANGTSGDQVCGIGISGGNGDQVVFNSISITGDMDPGVSTASTNFGNGIRIPGANGTNNANFTVQNNSIYLDANSNTSTVHFYDIALRDTAYAFGTGGLNYNNYFYNPANPQLFTGGFATASGGVGATEFQTLANWQTALTTPQDANSIQADPLYFSNTSDLHIQQSSPNVNAGTTISGIGADIDGQMRPNGANPDIGADEFYPSSGSVQLSSSSYDVLETAGMRTITVFRTGGANGAASVNYSTGGGTATGGGSCGGSVDYVTTSGTLNWADLDAAPKTFDVPICPDTVIEGVETFNVTLSTPVTATLGTPSMATVNIFNAGSTVGGSINVGTGQQVTSLTNPDGIFDVINNGVVTSNLTINITSDLTGETGAIALNEIPGGFTVLIKPSGAPRTISGTSGAASALIGFNGVDNLTLDGSLSGSTDRSLTVSNLITTTAGGGIYFASGTAGAQNNTVKNVNVYGAGATGGTLLGITVAGNAFGTAGTDNDNNRIENNDIRGTFYGIASLGASAANKNTGTVITRNVMPGTGTSGIGRNGIYVIFDDGAQITENNIASVTTGNAVDCIGIGAGAQALGTTQVTPFDVTNALIARNYIGVVNNTATNSSAGIVISSGPTGTNTVVNNMVTGVTGNADVGDLVAGIYVVPVAGATQNIYHNSVSMTGDRGTTANMFPSFALAISQDQPVNVTNNALFNSQTRTGATGGGGESYAIGFDGPAANLNLGSNYNDLFVSGPLGQIGITGDLTTSAQTTTAGTGTNQTTLTAWQTATTEDANSLSVDPMFVSLTDLHLQMGSPMINTGTNVGVITDYDGEPRGSSPDIGADEVQGVPVPGTLQFSAPTYSGSENAGPFTVTVTRTGGSDGSVTVNFATSNGTATGGAACTAGVDYISNSGTLTFADGVTSQTFNVTICNDTIDEPDETINYTLTNPTGGATLGMPSTAVQTIVDDDPAPPSYTVAVSDVRVIEGNSGMMNATFNVTLTLVSPPLGNIGGSIASVQYATANGTATAGSDYVATSGTLNFNSTGTLTVNVPVNGDTVKEANETFTLNLTNPSMNTTIADGQGVGIIVDEDRSYVSDFDGDRKADYSVFRPGELLWYVLQSSNSMQQIVAVSPGGNVAVPGDYDGDGRTDHAVFDNTSGNWFILRSSDSAKQVVNWGVAGDKPVQGDFDGDGKTDVAIFRPSTGTWWILRSSDSSSYAITFGINTDKPVQGDYDGDAKTDIAVYRNGVWYILQSSTNMVSIQNWGNSTDKPVSGDFDGDGKYDLTIYRNGEWWILSTLTATPRVVAFGLSTDIPAPADFDGDGTTDIAVFRPSVGDWFVLRSSDQSLTGVHWGVSGDIPIPSAYLPQ